MKMTDALSDCFTPTQRDYIAAAIAEALVPFRQLQQSQMAGNETLAVFVRDKLARMEERGGPIVLPKPQPAPEPKPSPKPQK